MARNHRATSIGRKYRKCGLPVLGVTALCIVVNILFTWVAGSRLQTFDASNGHIGVQPIVRHPARQTLPPRVSSENTAGFVHIGKTAGSTISKLLRNGCTSFVSGTCRNMTEESAVSKFVEHYYHVPDFHRLPTSKHNTYIISVRDVYDRSVSAFLYHHPKNAQAYHEKLTPSQLEFGPLAYGCFDTLEEFAGLMNGNSTNCNYPFKHNVVDATNCQSLACAVVHGKVRFFIHLFFNYRNIAYTKLPTDPPRQIYVLRQEKLWEDWATLNKRLGQEDPLIIPTSDKNERNISYSKLPISRNVSSEGRKKLCKALETEYEAYFRLLVAASNLNDSDMWFSQQVAQKNCPNLDTQTMLKRLLSDGR